MITYFPFVKPCLNTSLHILSHWTLTTPEVGLSSPILPMRKWGTERLFLVPVYRAVSDRAGVPMPVSLAPKPRYTSYSAAHHPHAPSHALQTEWNWCNQDSCPNVQPRYSSVSPWVTAYNRIHFIKSLLPFLVYRHNWIIWPVQRVV